MRLEGRVEVSQDSRAPDDLEAVDPADKTGSTEETRNFLRGLNQNPLGPRELASFYADLSPAQKRVCLNYVAEQSEFYRIIFHGYMDN
ncbi:MAG: hypothetical protein AAB857_02700 [Patescibacteria group bacterium]